MSQNPGESKIVVDSDWKAQAQAEREKMAAQEKKSAAAKGAQGGGLQSGTAGGGAASGQGALGPSGGPGVGGGQGVEELPPADFPTLLGTLITQALMYMGGFPDPETGRAMVSLEHAKFHIDLIAVLDEKTRGNLTTEEAADMTQAVNELRMRYVEISKAVSAAVARGAMKGGAAPGGADAGQGPGLVM